MNARNSQQIVRSAKSKSKFLKTIIEKLIVLKSWWDKIKN